MAGRKLGLLGGTFNPIHLGHLRAAEDIAEQLSLQQVLFIPAGEPHHKPLLPVLPFEHRLAMVRLAIGQNPAFALSDLEGRRDGPSYTVDTLRCLHNQYDPDLNLYFITGYDAFLDVAEWHDYRHLFDLANFVVIDRDGQDSGVLNTLLKKYVSSDYEWHPDGRTFVCPNKKAILLRNVLKFDISSTDIRHRLSSGQSIRYLVPEPVRRYIIDNSLYQDARS